MRLFAGSAVAHERGETIEGIHVTGGRLDGLGLWGVTSRQASGDPPDGGFIGLAAEPCPATCATSDLCHPGDGCDHHEHDKNEKNEFD